MAIIHTWRMMEIKLKLAVFISIIILLNYECYWWTVALTSISPFLTGLNKVVVQIIYAFFTGFVFYFFIELMQQNKKKIAVLRLIQNNIFTINHRIEGLLNIIGNLHYGKGSSYTLTYKDFTAFCNENNLHNTTVKAWYYSVSSLYDFVLHTIEEIERNNEYISPFYELFNHEWITNLVAISDNVRQMKNYVDTNGQNSTLSLCAYHIWDMYVHSLRLVSLSNDYWKGYNKIYRQQNPVANRTFDSVTLVVDGNTNAPRI